MCDQLRVDYLSCYGHKTLNTPNIDLLAEQGVRFGNAFVQSPYCGPSRMSFYTGRYVRSHGSTWNMAPLRVGELNIGDHLNPLGMRTVLCGKTHMHADRHGMQRLDIDPDSVIGAKISECGFEIWDRLDGVHPQGGQHPSHYNTYLNDKGYEGENPWHDWANSGETESGELKSGWFMENSPLPARIAEQDSETAYTTTRAIDFIENNSQDSWCLHVSYIKPHWPYIAPEPYSSMYSKDDVQPVLRSERERQTSHPLFQAYQQLKTSEVFAADEVRDAVIPVYMGLIKQIDDNLARLYQSLKDSGQWQDSLIVFTSDHGDYLGDHWMGEKEFFHDLLPTFTEFSGGAVPKHIFEGHSLLPYLQGKNAHAERSFVISEYDFSYKSIRAQLNLPTARCHSIMVYDGRYKGVFFNSDIPPILFDTKKDPEEFIDIANEPNSASVISKLRTYLLDWALRPHNRITSSDEFIEARTDNEPESNVYIGFWSESELDELSN